MRFVREGSDPTQGEPHYDLPFEQCIEQLGLTKNIGFTALTRKRTSMLAASWPSLIIGTSSAKLTSLRPPRRFGGQDFICSRSAQDRLRSGWGRLKRAEKRAGAASARLGPGRQITIGRWGRLT